MKSSDEAVDRISELPESLILHILSFLETKDAVQTSLLSKRWVDLWFNVPCLEFIEPAGKKNKIAVAIGPLIDKVLLRWRGTKILKFKIDLSSSGALYASSPYCDLDFWLKFATDKKVESLDVCLPFNILRPWKNPPVYRLPQCLYSCSSITKLRLVGFSLRVGGNIVKVQWYNLKTLHLEGMSFSEDVINQVVSSAPRLVVFNLCLYECDDNLTIRSSSLKCLMIMVCNLKRSEVVYEPSRYTKLTIWAPKLEELCIEGNAYSKCLLKDDFSSLTRASLQFFEAWEVALRDTLMQILPKIQHVESLGLSPSSFKMLGVMKGKYPPFSNVKTLRLSNRPINLNEIIGFAKIFSKVETLYIDWQCDGGWYHLLLENLSEKKNVDRNEAIKNLESFWIQLRRIEVITCYSYKNSTTLFKLIDFFFKHAAMLQEIVIQNKGNHDEAATAQLLQIFNIPTLAFHTCSNSKLIIWRR